jgi:hypothetical protein
MGTHLERADHQIPQVRPCPSEDFIDSICFGLKNEPLVGKTDSEEPLPVINGRIFYT